jgi:hypothetical protein
LYVDDIRVMSDTDEELDEIEQQVRARFPIETVDPNWWLGMKIEYDGVRNRTFVTQEVRIHY